MNSRLRQILVHLDSSPRMRERLVLARRIAQEHGANLAALYAVVPTLADLAYAPEAGASVVAALREVDDARRDSAESLFLRTLEDPGPTSSWAETCELPLIRSFAQQAVYADLLVFGQYDPADARARDVPPEFASAVMLASGRPGLIVPFACAMPARFDKIAVAWKPTPEAAHAVSDALPFLERAGRVVVLAWGEESVPVRGGRLDLDHYLRLHGIEPEWRRGGPEPEDIGELLLSQAFQEGADLLVMGCYGHSRAREWALGGASRTVLRSMTLPVLMSH